MAQTGMFSTNGMKYVGFSTTGRPNMSGSEILKSDGTSAMPRIALKRSDLVKSSEMLMPRALAWPPMAVPSATTAQAP